MIRLVLPYPLSANRYWASTSIPVKGKRKFRAITYVTEAAKEYKETVAKLAMVAGVREPITGRVCVVIKLFPRRPLDWAKRARKDPDGWADTVQCIDLDNARKVLYDALKGIAYDDDKWIKRDAGEICEPDGEARVEVVITPIVRAPIAPALFEDAAA